MMRAVDNYFATSSAYAAMSADAADEALAEAAEAERRAVEAIIAGPIGTADDAAAVARVLAAMCSRREWPEAAAALARRLGGAVERQGLGW